MDVTAFGQFCVLDSLSDEQKLAFFAGLQDGLLLPSPAEAPSLPPVELPDRLQALFALPRVPPVLHLSDQPCR
jgi:hypothetical protein